MEVYAGLCYCVVLGAFVKRPPFVLVPNKDPETGIEFPPNKLAAYFLSAFGYYFFTYTGFCYSFFSTFSPFGLSSAFDPKFKLAPNKLPVFEEPTFPNNVAGFSSTFASLLD